MAREEQVLVVRRAALEEAGLFHGLNFDISPYLRRLFAPGALEFMPRPPAEADPSYKQLIPYVVITCGDKCLSYVRGKRAGETRLVGNRSIGIGGHVNPVDEMQLLGMSQSYLAAVDREVKEEVTLGSAVKEKRIVALLNDDSNEVGKVHIGVVHNWVLEEPQVEKREQMITQMEFLSVGELAAVRDTMETWSQLCLDSLEEIMSGGESESMVESIG